jgi:hypothetical protein
LRARGGRSRDCGILAGYSVRARYQTGVPHHRFIAAGFATDNERLRLAEGRRTDVEDVGLVERRVKEVAGHQAILSRCVQKFRVVGTRRPLPCFRILLDDGTFFSNTAIQS